MMNLQMTSSRGCALLTVSGSIASDDDLDTFDAALSFVPLDDHLILDLTAVTDVTAVAARRTCELFAEFVATAEAVIVSSAPPITLQLVLGNVDRVVPVVPTVEVATAIIRARSYRLVPEVA